MIYYVIKKFFKLRLFTFMPKRKIRLKHASKRTNSLEINYLSLECYFIMSFFKEIGFSHCSIQLDFSGFRCCCAAVYFNVLFICFIYVFPISYLFFSAKKRMNKKMFFQLKLSSREEEEGARKQRELGNGRVI